MPAARPLDHVTDPAREALAEAQALLDAGDPDAAMRVVEILTRHVDVQVSAMKEGPRRAGVTLR